MSSPSSTSESPRRTSVRLIVAALVLGVLFIGPLIVPIPPAKDTVAPRSLADPDSRFATVDGVELHYKVWGSPDASRTVVLVHGFGASVFSWRDVGPALAARGFRVIAADRTGFGLTERPATPLFGWGTRSPYSLAAQADQAAALCRELDVRHAVVVGHSQGAGTAVLMAARHPSLVDGIVLAAPALDTAWAGGPARIALASPQARRLGPLFVRRLAVGATRDLLIRANADPTDVTSTVTEGYSKPLRARGWDRGLWEQAVAAQPELPDAAIPVLAQRALPALVVVPLADRMVPVESEREAAQALHAQEPAVPGGAHVYHEEHPRAFADAVGLFIERSVYADVWCRSGG